MEKAASRLFHCKLSQRRHRLPVGLETAVGERTTIQVARRSRTSHTQIRHVVQAASLSNRGDNPGLQDCADGMPRTDACGKTVVAAEYVSCGKPSAMKQLTLPEVQKAW
jgi:hypothetical protein